MKLKHTISASVEVGGAPTLLIKRAVGGHKADGRQTLGSYDLIRIT